MIKFSWQTFSKLSPEELYQLLKLRSEVFIVEQNCVFLDLDDQDQVAIHLLGVEGNKVVAYLRLFAPNDIENYIVFGRVVTARSVRAKGYGKKLIQELIDYCKKHFPNVTIKCSAQHYLLKFYQSFGFKEYGEIYMEDNIPHVAMRRG